MVKKFTSYLVVGGIAFIVDAGITLALAKHIHYVAANTAGFVIANLVNFLLAHKWVFHGKLEPVNLGRAYLPTLLVSVMGLLLSNLFMVMFVGFAGWSLLPAKILTTMLVLVWNFFGRIKFIYR